eukprot:TRINITY_DN13658_c0_g1_i5.p1 TRINITY_DN13658_c0_g1~~TRINITY_DN13658_c0_g1_i5.p1  ORF type:complete len:207 (-),score=34.86 TRINITY_DN13658_c0_g1_i5:265-885(-)
MRGGFDAAYWNEVARKEEKWLEAGAMARSQAANRHLSSDKVEQALIYDGYPSTGKAAALAEALRDASRDLAIAEARSLRMARQSQHAQVVKTKAFERSGALRAAMAQPAVVSQQTPRDLRDGGLGDPWRVDSPSDDGCKKAALAMSGRAGRGKKLSALRTDPDWMKDSPTFRHERTVCWFALKNTLKPAPLAADSIWAPRPAASSS